MIAVALALLIVLAIGLAFSFLARTKSTADLFGGTSFFVGMIAVTLAMLLLSVAGVSWSPLSVSALALIVAGSGLALRRAALGSGPSVELATGWGRIADGLLVLVLLVHALYVTESAPRDWDYWAIWGLKAKVFFAAGGTIDWSFLREGTNGFAHPDYPPLLSLSHGWLASWSDAWNDRWFGLLETSFVLALLVSVRGQVAAMTRSAKIGAWTALVLSFPVMQSRFAIADVPLFAFVTAGLLWLQRDLLDRSARGATIGFILIGGAALTKNEGLTWLAIAVVAHAVISREARRTVTLALPGIAIAAVWQIPRIVAGLSADLAGEGAVGRAVERLFDPAWTATLVRAAPPELTAALIGLTIAALIARARLLMFTFLLIAVAAQLAIYLAVYASTPYDAAWHVATSWDRISLHLAIPVLVAAITSLVERAERRLPLTEAGDPEPRFKTGSDVS